MCKIYLWDNVLFLLYVSTKEKKKRRLKSHLNENNASSEKLLLSLVFFPNVIKRVHVYC